MRSSSHWIGSLPCFRKDWRSSLRTLLSFLNVPRGRIRGHTSTHQFGLSAKLVTGLIRASHSGGTRFPLSGERPASASSRGTPTAAAAHASTGLDGWSHVKMSRSHRRRTCTQYNGCGSSYHSDRHGESGLPTRSGGTRSMACCRGTRRCDLNVCAGPCPGSFLPSLALKLV